MFNKEELTNISVLIERANITGKEALPVAVLQQKIQKLLAEVSPETLTGTPTPVASSETTSTQDEPKTN